MKKNWLHIKAVVLPALLAGCAYHEPTSGPTANVVFSNRSGSPASVVIYENATDCTRGASTDTFRTLEERKLKVRANQELALTFGYSVHVPGIRQIISCFVTVTFLPAENQSYELHMLEQVNTCSVQGWRLGSSREPIALRRRLPLDAERKTASPCRPL